MADIPDDIEAFLSLGSRLPVLREDCLYHATQNIWVPEASLKKMKASERDVCLAVKFVFQLAKTANAKCRKCGLPIQREEIRLGYPISDPRGLHGVLMAWLHLKCGGKVISAAGKALKLGETDSERPSVESLSEAAEECVESGSTSPITDSIAGAVPASSDSAHLSIAASVDDSMADSEVASGLAEGLLAFVASSSDKENDDQSSAATDGAKLVEANKLVESVALPDAVLQSFFPAVSCLFFDWELLDDEKKYLVTRFALSEEIAENEDAGANVMKDMVRRVLTERYPPPPDLLMPLLPFQEEGLAWMCNQEISSVRGGILADEMGMGKTIQMIALLLTRQYRVASEPSMGDVLMPEGRGATLVVVPVAAVSQWKAEIERFSRPGSLRVLLYHGNGREALLSTLHLYDVVITTYSTVENDYRRVVNTHKSPCKYCGRMFLSEKLKIHQRYHCGPDADRTARQSKTEQKSKDAAQKAMKTLNIVAAAPSEEPPTLTNVYRSILRDGNRHEELNNLQRVPWLASRRRRTPEVVEREDIWMVPSDERKASPNGKKSS